MPPPTAGWWASIPESITATFTPSPALPPHAHSGVISSRGGMGARMGRVSGANWVLHAGRSSTTPSPQVVALLWSRAQVFGEAPQYLLADPGFLLTGTRDLANQGGELQCPAVGRALLNARGEGTRPSPSPTLWCSDTPPSEPSTSPSSAGRRCWLRDCSIATAAWLAKSPEVAMSAAE